jgi:hypothetical protein
MACLAGVHVSGGFRVIGKELKTNLPADRRKWITEAARSLGCRRSSLVQFCSCGSRVHDESKPGFVFSRTGALVSILGSAERTNPHWLGFGDIHWSRFHGRLRCLGVQQHSGLRRQNEVTTALSLHGPMPSRVETLIRHVLGPWAAKGKRSRASLASAVQNRSAPFARPATSLDQLRTSEPFSENPEKLPSTT